MTIPNLTEAADAGLAALSPPGAWQRGSCVVIGGSTLASRCIAMLHEAGHRVDAVLPTEPALAQWAREQGLRVVDTLDALDARLALHPVDRLFSIVNPLLLPASLLARVGDGGFNYHDAPLPRYGGTHATTWALLGQETRHAITWHRIATAVDAGEIAVQHEIEIEPAETALTLNLKCYQAAAAGFGVLLNGLAAGTLVCRAQDATRRSFFARRRRPEAAGFLRWDRSAQALSALVRALSFGPYHPNPLTLPKLRIAGQALWVSRLEVLPERSGLSAGTLVDIAPDHWRIATGSEDVAVQCSAPDGVALDPFDLAAELDVMDGECFALVGDAAAAALERSHEAVALDEAFWAGRLACLDPLPLPPSLGLAHAGAVAAPAAAGRWRSVHASATPEAGITLIWSAWLLQLAQRSGRSRLQLGWAVAAPAGIDAGCADCFARVVPTELELDRAWRPAELIAAVDAERERLARHRTYALDLVARLPSLRAMAPLHAPRPWALGITVTDGTPGEAGWSDALPGSVLSLQIDPSGGAFRLVPGAAAVTADLETPASALAELVLALTDAAQSGQPIDALCVYGADRGVVT